MVSWRDDKARATLIRDAAGSVQPGKTPRTFAELLFGHTNIEDLAGRRGNKRRTLWRGVTTRLGQP